MKIKKSFKMLIVICIVLLSLVATANTGLVHSIATIDGGVHEYTKAVVHIGHFIW